MKIIRFILGKIILTLDAIFSPKSMTRDSGKQALVDKETQSMSVYQLVACPFCVKVRRQMKRLALKIELKNIEDSNVHSELMAGGKQDQVPCLRLVDASGNITWMYESSDINAYLEQRFGNR
ncbi:MAG: glutathione S-transferase N-terminal domain-containing protein [Bdellovibrionales bacterium]|nr:glutathione S-transferase N-terminal domain-containing protein [Bdellovibrionales bacterium]